MAAPIRQRGGSRRLAPADRVWLGLDSPTNLMMVTAVLEFAEPVEIPALRAVLADRLLGAYPRFGQRVDPGRWPIRAPRWRPSEVDLDVHLQRLPGRSASLSTVVEQLLSEPLDLSHPPWQCHLMTTPTGDALVIRVHHCIADGIALASVLLALTDSPPDSPDAPAAGAPPAAGRFRLGGAVWAGARSALRGLQLVLLPPEPRTSLTGRPGVAKRAAWTPGLPLADVRAVAAAAGGSVNDVLLAVTAGALRRYLLPDGPPPDLRVFVPVNVRPPGTAQLGNRFGLLFPRLPVAIPDPLARVAAVARRMTALKATAEAASTYRLISLLGVLPGWSSTLAGRALGAKASAVVTNVPGPRQPVALAGARVSRLTYWVPQVGSIGVGISIFSYAGTVSIGVATDVGLVPDPSRLADAMTAEFAALRRAAGV